MAAWHLDEGVGADVNTKLGLATKCAHNHHGDSASEKVVPVADSALWAPPGKTHARRLKQCKISYYGILLHLHAAVTNPDQLQQLQMSKASRYDSGGFRGDMLTWQPVSVRLSNAPCWLQFQYTLTYTQ